MAVAEGLRLIDPYMTSYEAVGSARMALGTHFDELVEAGARPSQEDGKLIVYGNIYHTGGDEISDGESDELWEQFQEEGGVDSLSIRRNMQTGRISSARIHGFLPARLSKEEARGNLRADAWHARIGFPTPHDRHETQRAVLDAWQIPWAHLTLAGYAIGAANTSPARLAAYDELHANMTRRRDGAGIPLGAIAIEHSVYGRKAMLFPEQAKRLDTVMSHFMDGVRDAVEWHNQTTLEIARGEI